MKNIYGYIRVSSVKQGDGVSLEVQKRDIIAFAHTKNLNIVEWFEEQKSASKGFRPEFNRMIEMLYDKQADGFVAHKIDRMMRNRHDWAIINELIDGGCEVLSADGTTLDDVNGRFMGDIQAAVATRFSHNLAQETKKGLYGRLAQGVFPFRAPIGYLDNGKGNNKSIDDSKAPFIKQLFELYIYKGYSVPMLVDEMYSRGLRNLNGKKVTKNGMITILKSPFYAGIIRVKGQTFKGNHLPLITVKTHQKTQEILDGKANAKVFKHDFLFRKMITCKECGYKLIGELQKGQVYYRCHTKDCSTKSINESTAECFINKMLRNISITDSEFNIMKNKLSNSESDWQDKQREFARVIKLKENVLNNRQERITNLLIEGTIEKDLYNAEKGKILSEYQCLEEQKKSIFSQDSTYYENIVEYLELAKSPYLLYDLLNKEEKREYLKKVTSNLFVEGKKLMISIVYPFHTLLNRHYFSLRVDNHTSHRKMESVLVLEDPNAPLEIQTPLDEAGCERFINYLVDNHFNN